MTCHVPSSLMRAAAHGELLRLRLKLHGRVRLRQGFAVQMVLNHHRSSVFSVSSVVQCLLSERECIRLAEW
jgi:hypothetical protein